MAEKLTPLILAALSRAAAHPLDAPLFAGRKTAGLFPNTAPAKAAAKRCLDEGWLRRTSTEAKPPVDRVTVTDKGLAYLLDAQNPKTVLEDIARGLDDRQDQVGELVAAVRELAKQFAGLKETLGSVVPKVASARVVVPETNESAAELMTALTAWSGGAGEDCPLPELYRRLASRPSLGDFHDALRALHHGGRLYLHPWTGPLYALPEPEYALVLGHEVVYYASPIAAPRLKPAFAH